MRPRPPDWSQTLQARLAALPLQRVRSQLDLEALEHAENHFIVTQHRRGRVLSQADLDAWNAYHDELRSRVAQSCPQALPTSVVTWGRPHPRGSGIQRRRRVAWSYRSSALGRALHQIRVACLSLRFRTAESG